MITSAVIPCFCEEKHIGEIVRKCKEYVDVVIVCDDHSTDLTRSIAEREGAKVALNPLRQGAGSNTAIGLSIACMFDADAVVTLDGDGQHDPNEISHVLAPILKHEADIVIGCRSNLKEMPAYRQLGNKVINEAHNLFNQRVGTILDTQSGFRAFTRATIENMRFEESGFGFSTEVLSKARKLGARIAQVDIRCIYNQELKDNSTLNPVKHGVGVLIRTIRWRAWEVTGL